MNKIIYTFLLLSVPFLIYGCSDIKSTSSEYREPQRIIVGAERTGIYFPWLKDKNIALIANQTSLINETHLVDSLADAGFRIVKIFSPEHGFRGEAEAGAPLESYNDEKTGIPVISLYGQNYKPGDSDLEDIDILIFDIQDVGARFYTYISTMTFAMKACADNNITFLVLDRPNPNGFYIDGPVLEKEFTSFVGLHPVPVVHGMTVAEYAGMVNNEGWLENNAKCDLKYVECLHYDHKMLYDLPVRPSPNLPDMTSVYLYPSLCFFEGTAISIGRGTDMPFKVIGHPDIKETSFNFTPISIQGVSLNPKFNGRKCYGYDLSDYSVEKYKENMQLDISWIIKVYNEFEDKDQFFNSYFNKLAGNSKLQEQIIRGESVGNIRASWEADLNKFKNIRVKYLLYND